MPSTFSFNVDEPKKSRDIRRRMLRRLRLRYSEPESGWARTLVDDLWPFVAAAYSAGYSAGHEDQMQMRIRDAMERRPERIILGPGNAVDRRRRGEQ